MTDYYKILNVDKNATTKEIRKAYRIKALEFHPDKNKSLNAKEKFIEVHEAYKVLSDVILRSKYDDLIRTHWDKVKNETSWTWTNDEINNRSRQARQQGTEYAENFDLFSKKVLKKNIGTFLLAILEILFGGLSSNSIGLFLIGLGLVFVLIPMADSDEKPSFFYWGGGLLIIWGIILFVRRWKVLAKESGEE